MRSHLQTVACAIAALQLAGCAAGGGDAATLSLPQMPKMADLTAAIPDAPEADPTGSATELYTRIARGAVGCWFGTEGGMKKAYIYHAEADAPSRGGKAEIVIHERDPTQPNPRGPKAYRIRIDPKDETSAVLATENLRIPEPIAAGMTADVNRWARGDQGCRGATTTAGWDAPGAGAPSAETAPKSGKDKSGKNKDKTKAAAKTASKPAGTPAATTPKP